MALRPDLIQCLPNYYSTECYLQIPLVAPQRPSCMALRLVSTQYLPHYFCTVSTRTVCPLRLRFCAYLGMLAGKCSVSGCSVCVSAWLEGRSCFTSCAGDQQRCWCQVMVNFESGEAGPAQLQGAVHVLYHGWLVEDGQANF